MQFRAVHFLILCAFEDGDLVEVDRWIQLGRGLLRRLRLPVPSYVLAEDDALRALLVGDLDDAERAGEHWQRMATVVGRTDRPEQLAYAFTLRLQQGRAGELSGPGRAADGLRRELDGLHAGGGAPRRRSVTRTPATGTRRRPPTAPPRFPAAASGIAAANLAFLAALFGDRAAAGRWYARARAVRRAARPRARPCDTAAPHYLGMLSAVTRRRRRGPALVRDGRAGARVGQRRAAGGRDPARVGPLLGVDRRPRPGPSSWPTRRGKRPSGAGRAASTARLGPCSTPSTGARAARPSITAADTSRTIHPLA